MGLTLWITESATYCSTELYEAAFRIGTGYTQKLAQPLRTAKNPQPEPKIHLDAETFSAHLANSTKELLMSELVAYVDGGSLGNPGPSGIGVVIDGCASGPIRISRWIGHQDNNVAEYVALLEALQCALSLKAKALHVYSDSRSGRPPDARRVYLPQLAPLLSALDLPEAGSRPQFLHLSRAARG